MACGRAPARLRGCAELKKQRGQSVREVGERSAECTGSCVAPWERRGAPERPRWRRRTHGSPPSCLLWPVEKTTGGSCWDGPRPDEWALPRAPGKLPLSFSFLLFLLYVLLW